ncbi:heme oxygenase (biliverdin-producing) [Nocardioides sp. Bht2]|uniref:biliverdin-producing heme oxygenase n=1 Tax=Nocardioides sp. Bht2 TaxID=3392297 RepID=UPI0039B60B03
MTLLETTPTEALSVAMRQGSMAEHTEAENAGFTSLLLEGKINELGYLHYLEALRTVYGALEKVGRTLLDDAWVGTLHDLRLERGAAIDADLQYWSERAGVELGNVSAAATGYAERVEAAAANPLLYVAHHYTRYLGDLSGGLAIGRVLGRTYEVAPGSAGLAFYEFAEIEKPKVYKDGYRAALDALPLDAEQRTTVVNEVKVAFGQNQALFNELGENLAAYQR